MKNPGRPPVLQKETTRGPLQFLRWHDYWKELHSSRMSADDCRVLEVEEGSTEEHTEKPRRLRRGSIAPVLLLFIDFFAATAAAALCMCAVCPLPARCATVLAALHLPAWGSAHPRMICEPCMPEAELQQCNGGEGVQEDRVRGPGQRSPARDPGKAPEVRKFSVRQTIIL